jgi:hypothetical protein
MRNVVTFVCALAVLFAAAPIFADGWDYTVDLSHSPVGRVYINPCSEPPQIIEVTEGNVNYTLKAKNVTDDEGTWVGFDINMHLNHQGVKGMGYDCVVGEDGHCTKEDGEWVKAVDEETGEFITVGYNIPGTFNYEAKIHSDDGSEIDSQMTFMCNLISYGNTANALQHFNGVLHMDNEGNVDHEFDHYWAKCAGAGPDKNGAIDCDEWPEFCTPPDWL